MKLEKTEKQDEVEEEKDDNEEEEGNKERNKKVYTFFIKIFEKKTVDKNSFFLSTSIFHRQTRDLAMSNTTPLLVHPVGLRHTGLQVKCSFVRR